MHAWLAFAILALTLWGVTGVTQKLSTKPDFQRALFPLVLLGHVALSASVLLVAHLTGNWEQWLYCAPLPVAL